MTEHICAGMHALLHSLRGKKKSLPGCQLVALGHHMCTQILDHVFTRAYKKLVSLLIGSWVGAKQDSNHPTNRNIILQVMDWSFVTQATYSRGGPGLSLPSRHIVIFYDNMISFSFEHNEEQVSQEANLRNPLSQTFPCLSCQ